MSLLLYSLPGMSFSTLFPWSKGGGGAGRFSVLSSEFGYALNPMCMSLSYSKLLHQARRLCHSKRDSAFHSEAEGLKEKMNEKPQNWLSVLCLDLKTVSHLTAEGF